MYEIDKNGVTKRIETWQVIIPKHDNEGKYFDESLINKILEDITLSFPGFTVVNCVGYWKDQKRLYRDENLQIVIDALPREHESCAVFFDNLKKQLAESLKQEKIYVTQTSNKVEHITFKEFFDEIGLEINGQGSAEENKSLAEKLVNRQDFVMQRLGYETMVLQRSPDKKKIIWERKICGIIIKSEIENDLPEDAILCAADQMDLLGDVIFGQRQIVIIGDYEYQQYFLEKLAFKPLVEAKIDDIDNDLGFFDQKGNPITTKEFIHFFTMTVFCNYMILREENYNSQEIRINVGGDGSMQRAESLINGNVILLCPASIPEQKVQKEILRCLVAAISLYESNELDYVAILQAKARNSYVKKRAIIRKQMKSFKKDK